MSTTVGFVGLGRMGAPMVATLRGAGWSVRPYDVSPAASAEAGGMDTIEEAFAADVVVLMLPSSRQVEEVLGNDPTLDAMPADAVVVDMGSSEPASTRRIGTVLRERGIGFVDAPVSGGVARAVTGQLTIMVGGADDAVDRVRPLLASLGTPTRVGDLGAGHALKACNNVLNGISLLAAVEVLEVVRAFGIDPVVAFDVINASTGRSWSTEHKIPKYVVPEDYSAGFAAALLAKDIGIACDLATSLGVEHGLMDVARSTWDRAADELPAGADHTAVAAWAAARRRGDGS